MGGSSDDAVDHLAAPDSGIVELAFWTESGAVCIEVADRGHWRRCLPGHPTDGGGIQLMRGCVDVVFIDHDRQGTRVHLRRRTTL